MRSDSNSVEEDTFIPATLSNPPTTLPRTAPGRLWQGPTVSILLLLAVTLFMFWRTAWSMGNTWYSSRTFSHGFLIIPMFVYLVWVRRRRLAALLPKPNYCGLPVLAILAGIWLLGSVGDVRIVQQFALVAMLDAMVWTLLGSAVVRALWFPLAFLFFAVPFGAAAIGPLQDFTAHFAVAALRLSRVPVILENRTIWVPSGPWVVAEACSGIRYLISSFVLALIYASLVYRSRKRRAIFILASIAVPIVANGIRAYGIILLAYLTDNRLAVGVDHIVYGWIFFTAIQLLLFSVGLRWREPVSIAAGPVFKPSEAGSNGRSRVLQRSLTAWACALMVVSWAPLAQAYLRQQSMTEGPAQLTMVVHPPWQPTSSYDFGWAPLLHPASESRESYMSGPERVDVYLARYSGAQALELVNGYNRLSDVQLWSEFDGGLRTATINGQSTTVRWDVVHSALGPRMVWTCYSIAGSFTASPTKVKLLQAEARLSRRPADTAVIVLSSTYLLDPSEANAKLEDFFQHVSIATTPSPTGQR